MPERFLKPGYHLEWAASGTASPDFLASVSTSHESWVRESVAGHERVDPATLAAMVPDDGTTGANVRLIEVLAGNPRTPVASLSAIADHVRAGFGHRSDHRLTNAGVALFARPDFPAAALLTLLDDAASPRDFRLCVATTTNRSDMLERLRSDPCERVRRAALRNQRRPLNSMADIAGEGGLVETALLTRRSTTGGIFREHFIDRLERLLIDVDDDTYLTVLDATAFEIARVYDDGSVTFRDADDLINQVWSLMAFSPRDRPFADVATAVYEAFDAGEHDHGDGTDGQATYTEPLIRSILAPPIP
ncbi:hypothetical protein BH10ACT1_BH10ACT1_16730 [soil metagenome]